MAVGVGDPAPDFTLPATGSGAWTLSEHRGGAVVLVFYPADNSPVCTRQLSTYSGDIGDFDGLGACVVALSPQDVDSHDAFASKHKLAFPLLADPDKVVGGQYGVLGPLGFYRRSVFVVDGGGTIRYAHRAVAGLTFRRTDELVAAIKAVS